MSPCGGGGGGKKRREGDMYVELDLECSSRTG